MFRREINNVMNLMGFVTFVTFLFVLISCFHVTSGVDIKCEDLDKSTCAFAVASSGKRCVMEKQGGVVGNVYVCRTSEIMADRILMQNRVESESCIKACGVDRNTLGISSDLLLEPGFVKKLCSSECYSNCPNIVTLYFNLAAGEGVFLPSLCRTEKKTHRRGMSDLRSSGMVVAPGPSWKASPSLRQ